MDSDLDNLAFAKEYSLSHGSLSACVCVCVDGDKGKKDFERKIEKSEHEQV